MQANSLLLLRRCAALFLGAPLAALANPTGGNVATGAATITHAGSTTTITQGTDRAVINWNDFNVGAGELTRFVQPGAQSAVLNRVTGGNPTQIFGRLEGNGRVFVLNPNGVLVGAGGVVQTQGFIASTLNVADRDFMAGADLRLAGAATAEVANFGRIDAGVGDVVLVAQRVRNAGDISGGTVGLAAGNDVLLARDGDTRLWVKSGVTGSGGTGVDHSGTISAVQAELKAAGGNVYSLAVNVRGLVSARGVAERGGRIYLTSEGGNIEVAGTLQAQGAGGQGGEIYVGGGYQGKDAAVANAANTTVTSAARLDAGGETDTGGTIVVWADGRTDYAGALQTGGGGQAEVSGKGTLDFTGAVNTRGGRLLLDPADITIDNANFAALIGNPLLTGAVTLSATNDITYNTSNPIQSNFTLEWDAGRDVNFAPTSAFGSMGAGNNVDFQIYAGRDVNFGTIAGLFFSAGGKALIRAGRDIHMAASSAISFGSGGWILLSADTDNSTAPAQGAGQIVLDSTSNLAAAKVQIFAASPAQFINNSGGFTPPAPTYNTWEEDIDISAAGSGLWFKSNSSGTFGPATSPLLITANNASRTYGSPNPAFSADYSGLTNGDTQAVVTGLQFATTATLGSNVGTYTITPFGATAPAYYDLSYAPGTLTIGRAGLSVFVTTGSRYYGDPNPAFNASYIGLKNGDRGDDVVTGLVFSTPAGPRSAPGGYPVNLSGGSALNYALSLAPGVMTISAAPLTVTLGNVLRLYGETGLPGTVTITGLKNGEDDIVLAGTLNRSTTATATSGVGTYPLTGSGLRSTNYDIIYVPASLSITPAPLTIKANDTSRMQGADNLFTATYTGFRNSDTAAVVSNLLFATPATPSAGMGTYVVTPYGAKAANYSITYQPGSLTVTQSIQTLPTTASTTPTGVTGAWTETALLQTLTQAQLDGYALMNAHISPALQNIDASKAAVMAESVQNLLLEQNAVNAQSVFKGAGTNAINRLLLYMEQNWGMGPDTTNYADFVHSLIPTWLPQLKELALADPELRGWLAQVSDVASFAATVTGNRGSPDDLLAGFLQQAAWCVAYNHRSPDEKAIATAAVNYVATRQAEMNARLASLQGQIAAQITAEDPTVPKTRLDQMFMDVGDEPGMSGLSISKGTVVFETNTTVAQKWAEYYALKAESAGYHGIVEGQRLTKAGTAGQPNPMVFVLKNLLDQGKIQIY